jgi:hypothetical protein
VTGLHNSTSHRTDPSPTDKQYPEDNYSGAIRVLNNLGKTLEIPNYKPKKPRGYVVQ